MFGYLSIDKSAPSELRNYFKYSYCLLCKSLEYYYGQGARLLLSYDMVVLSLLLIDVENMDDKNKIRCLEKPSKYSNVSLMKTIADLNIILFREKLKDNLIDKQHVRISKIVLKLYNKTLKKVDKNNPSLSKFVAHEFDNFYKKQGSYDVVELCNSFSKVMVNIAKEIGVNDKYLKILKDISRWIYFIDAIDDIEKDIKHKQFNPLINIILNYDKNSIEYYNAVISTYTNIFEPDISILSNEKINECIIYHLLKNTIPLRTIKIIRNKKYV